jgi:hypothetical protein
MPRSAVVLLALAACNNEEKLAELEARQTELRAQYDETARQTAEMRKQLLAMGVIAEGATAPPKGKNTKAGGAGSKAKLKAGNPIPTNDVTAAFGVTAARTGEIPTLPPLNAAPERSESPCGWKFVVKELADISDYNLNSLGLGRSGPVLLLADGAPLASHATPAQYDESCAHAFRHAGWAFLFSPEAAPENAEKHSWSLALDTHLPAARGEDGRPMYWVYPGTTVTLTAGRAWDPSWGAMDVDVVTRRVSEGDPPKVTIAGQPVIVPDDKDTAHLHVGLDPIPAEPLIVTVTSEDTGAYVVIDTFTIGNAENAAVVTSEAAWKAAQRKSP